MFFVASLLGFLRLYSTLLFCFTQALVHIWERGGLSTRLALYLIDRARVIVRLVRRIWASLLFPRLTPQRC